MRIRRNGVRVGAVLVASLMVLSACGGGESAELPPLRGPDGLASESNSRPSRDDRSSTSRDQVKGDQGDEEEAEHAMCSIFDDIIELDLVMEGQMNNALRSMERAIDRGDRSGAEAAAADMVAKVNTAIQEHMPPLLAAYDELIATAPELESDVVLVRDFTVKLAQQLASTDGTLDGFVAVFDNQGLMNEGVEAGYATLRLDQVSRDECGLVLAN